jgi:class 3 adenylate cyclase/CHASE2 domain-containing sensor protein
MVFVSAVRLALVMALIGALAPNAPGLRRLEDWTEDRRFLLRGPRTTSAKIVLALATQTTLESLWGDAPTALWTGHLLEALRNARAAGARVIAVDIVFPIDADALRERLRADALRAAGFDPRRITTVQAQLEGDEAFTPDTALALWLASQDGRVILADDGVGSLIPALRDSGAPIGVVEASGHAGETTRTFPLRAGSRPTLPALAAARGRTDVGMPRVGPADTVRINYVDPRPEHAFPIVELGSLERPDSVLQDTLRDAIVFVAVGDRRSNDVHTGIAGQEILGTELLAHTAATLIDGRPLRVPAPPWAHTASAVAAVVGTLVAHRLRFSRGVGVLLLLSLGAVVAAQTAFVRADLVLPLAAPLLGLWAPFAAVHTHRAWRERRARQEVERLFGQYVSPRVRDYLLADPEHRALGGNESEATVMFFDLRGSTAYAEGRSPGVVIETLNALFARIVPCVTEHDGVVLRYTGDGFYAVFGAPMPLTEHAAAAVAAARAIDDSFRAINAQSAAAGQSPWGFGCGVHTGSLVSGNLGAADRPEFTVIGDTVNLAARLQDATKRLGVSIVLSERTWQRAGAPAANGPFTITVAGRKEEVQVRTL